MNFKALGPDEVEIMGVHMVLLPEAAIYIPSRKELLVADLHLGKVEHFRKHGVAVPGEVSLTDIDTLQALIATYLPTKVVFMGDLFHSKYNSSWESFCTMTDHFPDVVFHLVVGNHDILEHEHYKLLQLCWSYSIGDILCTHEPMVVPMIGRYNLCGHVHPAVRLRGKGRQYLQLPCFYFGHQRGIMPAFGTFTGLHTVKPQEGDKVYIIAEDTVRRVC